MTHKTLLKEWQFQIWALTSLEKPSPRLVLSHPVWGLRRGMAPHRTCCGFSSEICPISLLHPALRGTWLGERILCFVPLFPVWPLHFICSQLIPFSSATALISSWQELCCTTTSASGHECLHWHKPCLEHFGFLEPLAHLPALAGGSQPGRSCPCPLLSRDPAQWLQCCSPARPSGFASSTATPLCLSLCPLPNSFWLLEAPFLFPLCSTAPLGPGRQTPARPSHIEHPQTSRQPYPHDFLLPLLLLPLLLVASSPNILTKSPPSVPVPVSVPIPSPPRSPLPILLPCWCLQSWQGQPGGCLPSLCPPKTSHHTQKKQNLPG